MTTNDIDNFSDKVMEVIKQWFVSSGFHARKLTDTPIDDLQVVNKKYVDSAISPLPINLATEVTGTLPVPNGGTGATTLTGVLIGNGTSVFTTESPLSVASGGTGNTSADTHKVLIGGGSTILFVSPDTAGKVLTSNGTSADPSFQTLTSTAPLATSGQFNRLPSTTNGSVVIAHGLARTPVLVNTYGAVLDVDGSTLITSNGSYDATTGGNTCTYIVDVIATPNFIVGQDASTVVHIERETGGNFVQATCSVDATNITYTFTKSGAPSDPPNGATVCYQYNAIA